jgi:hypothetical protein
MLEIGWLNVGWIDDDEIRIRLIITNHDLHICKSFHLIIAVSVTVSWLCGEGESYTAL